jgi:hypothetical protein
MRTAAAAILGALLLLPAHVWAQGAITAEDPGDAQPAAGGAPAGQAEPAPAAPDAPSQAVQEGEDPAAPGKTGHITINGVDLPCIYISSDDLKKEYEKDEPAADSKYKGALLVITGEVAKVAARVGASTVTFSGEDLLPSVEFQFKPDMAGALSEIAVGHKITIVGECKGMGLLLPVVEGMSVEERLD